MSARKPLEAKFKPHVGRIFHLRKVNFLSTYKQGKASSTDGESVVDREEVFGKTVLVLDETNTRVCVTTSQGTVVWIQKYYLHRELTTNTEVNVTDTISGAVVALTNLSKNLKTHSLSSVEEQIALCRAIEEIASDLRKIGDATNTLLKKDENKPSAKNNR